MRPRLTGLLAAAAVLVGSATWLAAQEPDVRELTRELTGEKPAAKRSAQQLQNAYAKVLDALLPDMGDEDVGKQDRSQRTLERIAFRAGRPGAETDRAACAKALAGRLGPQVPAAARVWMLRQIQRIGRAEAVNALAKALADKDAHVRESARRALEKNPSRQAGEALGKAVASASQPAWRAAVINALAGRSDAATVRLLVQEADSDNDDVRSAAVAALAKAGDASAAGAVAAAMTRGSAPARREATNAYVVLAGALADKGDKAAALGMYRKMLAGKGHLRCAGLIGLGRAGGTAELPALFDALADRDVRTRGAAVEALSMMPGKDITRALVAKVRTAGPEIKPALLRAIALRGEKGLTATFLAAAKDADEAVRVEALRGLGMIGDASAVRPLLQAAATTGPPQQAARRSLQRTTAQGVDRALLGAIGEKGAKVRLEVVRALSARHVTTAAPDLLKAAKDDDAGVRQEAIKALGAVGGADCLPAVAALLVAAPDDGTRNEAASALVRIAGREADTEKRTEPILKALQSGRGAARLSLLGVLGRLGGAKSLPAVRAATKDPEAKVKEAAIRALAEWPDAAAADDLLAIAKSAPSETLSVIALRGYIRVCRIRTSRPQEQSAKMLIAGLEAAKRRDEKRRALAGLAEVRHVLALQAVLPYLDEDALKREAASAATRIGRGIWNSNPQAVKAAMEKVLQVTKDDRRKREATEALDRAEKKLKEAKPRN